MFQRILVPLDGSSLAELALPYAEEIAKLFQCEVVLLYVSQPAESEYRHMHQLYIEQLAGEVGNRIRDYGSDMANPVVTVKAVVLPGEPAGQIIDYAERHDIDPIIMATHGRSGITPWAMGGVANKVLQATTVPVLLIRATKPSLEAPRKHLLDRILLPLDGSEAGEAAVPYIKELINRLVSEVILFGVVPAGQHVRTIGGLDYIVYPEQHIQLTKAEAKEYLDKVSHRLAGGKGTVSVEVRVGDVTREIIKFAEESDMRLIAISAHGHSGIKRWVFGSNAHKILHTSNTPVLLVKVPGAKV